MTRPSLPAGGQQARKVRQLVSVQVGNQADAHALGGGALDVEPVARVRAVTRPVSRPHEGIDQVLPALVDEDRDGTAADVVEPGAGELEPLRRKIRDRRRERQPGAQPRRSEEHTSELQSRLHLVCRLLLEKKKKTQK